MKLVTKKNTTAFTTRSLVRVVRYGFERAGVKGKVELTFEPGKQLGTVYPQAGQRVEFPGSTSLVAKPGTHARFKVGLADQVRLCSLAKWAGYILRGVTRREAARLWHETEENRVYLADKPLELKKKPKAKPALDPLAKKIKRCAADLARAMLRAKRATLAVKRLVRKMNRLEKLAVKREGEQGT